MDGYREGIADEKKPECACTNQTLLKLTHLTGYAGLCLTPILITSHLHLTPSEIVSNYNKKCYFKNQNDLEAQKNNIYMFISKHEMLLAAKSLGHDNILITK